MCVCVCVRERERERERESESERLHLPKDHVSTRTSTKVCVVLCPPITHENPNVLGTKWLLPPIMSVENQRCLILGILEDQIVGLKILTTVKAFDRCTTTLILLPSPKGVFHSQYIVWKKKCGYLSQV